MPARPLPALHRTCTAVQVGILRIGPGFSISHCSFASRHADFASILLAALLKRGILKQHAFVVLKLLLDSLHLVV